MPAPSGLLRVVTCGSVDDGKSTLIGRLLHDTHHVFTDQARRLEADSRRHGTTGDAPDLALLLDGLQAEREQGITIDVAWRFITTARRRLVIADAPGHGQHLGNMATGASTADAAVVLVDARHGLTTQTRRHTAIVRLMGIRHVVLAVNKMDLVGFDPARFDAIAAAFRAAPASAGCLSITAIPLCARSGENVVDPGPSMPWYDGPTLLACLETLDVDAATADAPFRMPVQLVGRTEDGGRTYSGTVASGRVAPGDAVLAAGGNLASTVGALWAAGHPASGAVAGQAVSLTLTEAVDLVRGDVLTAAAAPLVLADQFQAHLIWLHPRALVPGRAFLFQIGTALANGSVTRIRERIDVDTGAGLSARVLENGELGVVNATLHARTAMLPFAESRELGGFIMIDRDSNATVAAGTIDFPLARAANLHRQALSVTQAARTERNGHPGRVLWFTGLSGAGKSTLANLVELRLFGLGMQTILLDGDNLRHGLNRDLGFTEADRVENVRRLAELGALLAGTGLVALVSAISPYRRDRDAARDLVEPGAFLEIFVDTPVEECRRRDVKGLYAKADAGGIPNFTGVSAPYEAPVSPDIHVQTVGATEQALAELIVNQVVRGMEVAPETI